MKSNKVQTAINNLANDIRLHQENITEAAELFADGKIDQASLAQAYSEHSAALTLMDALQSALVVENNRDTAAELADALKARQDAAKLAEKLLAQRQGVAADIDSTINTLINLSLSYAAINQQINSAVHDTGVSLLKNSIHSYIDLRPIDAVLAANLSQSGLSVQMQFITIAGVQHTRNNVEELSAKCADKIRATIQHRADL